VAFKKTGENPVSRKRQDDPLPIIPFKRPETAPEAFGRKKSNTSKQIRLGGLKTPLSAFF